MASRFFGLDYWRGNRDEEDGGKTEVAPSSQPSEPSTPQEIVLATSKCDLFQYYFTDDPKFYLKLRGITANITKYEDEAFSFALCVVNGDGKTVIVQSIHNTMQLETYEETHSIAWTMTEGGVVSQWSLVFCDAKEESKFVQLLKICLWETSTRTPFSKVDEVDKAFVLGQYTYNSKTATSSSSSTTTASESERERDDDTDSLTDVDLLAFEQMGIHDDQQASPKQDDLCNTLLSDSWHHKKCFVIRGPNVGVFNRTDDDVLFNTEITGLVTPAGKTLQPSKILLHNQDNTLLALSADNPAKMYPIDLEVGKVVEEWKANEYDTINLLHMTPTTKYGGVIGEPTVAVMGHNVCVGFDPRLSGPVKSIGDPAKYMYTKSPEFTCCATTRQGHLVIGNAKGEIRLYSAVPGMPNPFAKRNTDAPKTAKTCLPGCGDAIKALDVTADGRWILATTQRYLLVVNTVMGDTGELGYAVRMGQDKPHPLRLQLQAHDLAKIGGPAKVDFTAARFNTGAGEHWIVTSTGPYLVTWNFKYVKIGDTTKYVIKKTGNEVICDQFYTVDMEADGTRVPIVLAHKNDVRVEKRVATEKSPYRKLNRTEFQELP